MEPQEDLCQRQCPVRVGGANNYVEAPNVEAFLGNLPECALAAGRNNTLVYSNEE